MNKLKPENILKKICYFGQIINNLKYFE